MLRDIENDSEIMGVRFTGLLDEVANVLEKHGFGIVRAFLLEKQSRRELERQARALLKVLDKIQDYPDVSADRKAGRLVIKAVSALQQARRRR